MSFVDDWNLRYPYADDEMGNGFLVVRGRTAGGGSAGQFEIAGRSYLPDGSAVSANDLDGCSIVFELMVPSFANCISVSTEYPVNLVGGKLRIKIQGDGADRPNVGNLFAALLLLPTVGKINDSNPLDAVGFTDRAYWIDAIQTRIKEKNDGVYVLVPTKIIVATGSKNNTQQYAGAMSLDFENRIEHILDVYRVIKKEPAGGVPAALKYYVDVYKGRTSFDYSVGKTMRELIMEQLERINENYVNGHDPLLALIEHADALDSCIRASRKANNEQSRNLIYFGAPGTGKSHGLNELAIGTDERIGCFDEDNVTRVTFHPDYTYAQFVGCYKPYAMTKERSESEGYDELEDAITYRFVPGPFLETYIKAMQDPDTDQLLIIEEINRANPAAVFGDIFQLLDRDEDGVSEYSVATSEDLRWYLFKQWKSHLNSIKPQERSGVLYSLDDPEAERFASSIALPKNMYIWATMNSADQGVYPMDTAFKRRWDFEYMDIDNGEDIVASCEVPNGDTGEIVRWNWLRKLINGALLDVGVNEDKLLGPFFIAPSVLERGDQFRRVFENKVLMYLYEDAVKLKRPNFFTGEKWTYSTVCKEYKDGGIEAVLDEKVLGTVLSNLDEPRHAAGVPSKDEPSSESVDDE